MTLEVLLKESRVTTENLHKGGGGKGAQLTDACAIVFDEIDGFVFVEGAEVVTR